MEQLQSKIKEFFNGLQFEAESHRYEVKGKPLTSVSDMIKKYVEKVDYNKIAEFMARREGVTKEVILARWNAKRIAACDRGTSTHNFGEYFNPKTSIPSNGLERAVVNFWDNIPDYMEPVFYELKMFSENLGIAGTADLFLYNRNTGKFIIVDYKTNEDLFKNHKGKKLLPPFNDLLDCPYNKYQIQLSMYQLLFEQCGFEVESRRVIWLKPDGSYENFKTIDLTKEILNDLT